jgi:hypothetical protein
MHKVRKNLLGAEFIPHLKDFSANMSRQIENLP